MSERLQLTWLSAQWVAVTSLGVCTLDLEFLLTPPDLLFLDRASLCSWLLLDEINLAPPETLERLVGLLDGPDGSIVVSERGDMQPVARHPGSRIFGAMNPATDVGKRDLPAALKNHFTEVYVAEPSSREDLCTVVRGCVALIQIEGLRVEGLGYSVDSYTQT